MRVNTSKYIELTLDSVIKSLLLSYLIVFGILGATIVKAEARTGANDYTQVAFLSRVDTKWSKSEKINFADAQALVDRLISRYEKGRIDDFASVFYQYVRTEDSMSRATLRLQYENLFAKTDSRLFILNGIDWRKINNKLIGYGSFQVKIKTNNGKYIQSIKGKFTMDVEKKGNKYLITKFINHQ